VGVRSATVRSFAKLNLDLRVLHRRPDGYHELRTIFQTISLFDTISVSFERARRTELTVEGNVDIPNNLVIRAARAVLDSLRIAARVSFRSEKRIPMGAGLGGGSSNAAAVLLTLPVLAGAQPKFEQLLAMAGDLGSDVTFFLYGGTALGVGRGTELYPLMDVRGRAGVLVTPNVAVSTAEAYADLGRKPLETLTTGARDFDTDTFRSLIWSLAETASSGQWTSLCANDFERAVFERHPVLLRIQRKLAALGARPARMTGSGSAVFGLFDSADESARARVALNGTKGLDAKVFAISLLSRRRYRALWRKQLAEHTGNGITWPPLTRYSKP
jgi:4-diphosphocytidyl-2-C-methyl-D-erythritol kinase